MGHLLQVLLAIAAQAAVESGADSGVELPLLVPFLALVPYAIAARARRQAFVGRFRAASRTARQASLAPPVLQFVALGGLGWFSSVERWAGAGASLFEWPSFALLLVLAPYVVFTLASIDAQARLAGNAAAERARHRRFQVRMFASTLAPLVVYVALSAAVGTSRALRVQVEQVAIWNGLFSVTLLAFFALLLPWVLRGTWDTIPLPPGPQRMVLEHVAARARFRCRELLIWRTGGMMANAAIVGLTPRDRVVLFSDSLLAQLGPRQLAAVFGHEIGHARRHHVPIFLAWAVGFFLAADLVAAEVDPEGGWLGLAVVGVAIGLWALGFGWLSRRFELEADLESLDLVGDPNGLISALEAVGGHLRDVAGWRHFSVADRARFLERAAAEPGVGRKLRKRLRLFAVLGVLFVLSSGGLHVRALAGSYPADRVVADLCLGEYSRAAGRLAELEDADEELVQLVGVAAALASEGEAGPIPRERVAAAAHDALNMGAAERAARLLLLAELAGDEDAARVRRVIERIDDGDLRGAREEAAPLPERWAWVLPVWDPGAGQ